MSLLTTKGAAEFLGQLFDLLAGAGLRHLMADCIGLLGAEIQAIEGFLEEGAGVGQLYIVVAVLEVADIAQGEDGFTAVAFAAADGGDGAGGGYGRLGGIADPVAGGCLRTTFSQFRAGRPQLRRCGASGRGGFQRIPPSWSAS